MSVTRTCAVKRCSHVATRWVDVGSVVIGAGRVAVHQVFLCGNHRAADLAPNPDRRSDAYPCRVVIRLARPPS